MKKFLGFATIASTLLTLVTPQIGRAQGVFVQPFPSNGYSSTTIYIPALPADRGYINNDVNTTTIISPISPNIYPYSNSFPGYRTTPDYGSGFPNKPFIPASPTLIYPQQNYYPGAIQSACTTSIIGSPIPSPIALNRYTGTPCR